MQKKLLIIGYVWPEPNTTAAGGRMLQLLHFFIKHQYQISFASTASEGDYSFDLDVLGVAKVAIRLNHSSFDELLQDLDPDIVLFDRFMTEEQFGWRVAQYAPKAVRILDTEDLHSLRMARYGAYKKHTPFSSDQWLATDLAKREIASIYRCDFSLIISFFEIELLKEVLKIPDQLILHLPIMVHEITAKDQQEWLGYHEKQDFVCIGNGKHAPNIDAVVRLKKDIWPLIRQQLPEANLRVYGAYLPEHILQMNKPREGFCVLGHAKEAKEVIGRARVNLAPLNFGAGIKGKLIDGMRFGTPSVTTTIGAEGMHPGYDWNGLIADDALSFANAAVALYREKAIWENARKNGVEIVNQLYNTDILEDRFYSRIEEVQHRLSDFRAKNFIGEMLMHHTMAGTKYMSKWIEAKNIIS
ncbi:Glycosyltransferase involved in cell wall bisynthesis [Arenibacter nanhaiticus]|uniref:Glycosyltransferase involved in cell wall bisynthesis n=1 Tax=Arenibacter nanhaiticus TaxID=558155 RepID=A0A1M6FTS5_9FLAO|nr:glycosyltransferase [Arenibacter nanhaiticus]SHJ01085.1 Glycosyltransferase involved in cell wall bisynthesis [Arenibacter nanhaiticus]